MLQRESVDNRVLELICSLQSESYLQDFFLVGGTGLALQIGHRKSDDLVLFTLDEFDQNDLLERLESDFGFSMDYMENNTVKGSIDNVKVDLLSHKYQLINPILEIENVRIASIKDISAMKLNAISNDGTRVKDFIDMYFLLQELTIAQMLENYSAKYELRNALHALKSLNYYKEVETLDWPEMLKERDLTWTQVKKKIDNALNEYIKSLKNT